MFWHLSVKKALLILLIFAIIGSTVIYYITSKKQGDLYTTAAVQRGRVVQTVSETGTVKAAEEINLSFLNTGQIRKIYFDIGAQVNEGDLLAELDYSSLSIKRQESQANLDVARQNLLKLQSGATVEEIQEVLLHSLPYCGAPTTQEAFRAALEVINEYQKES